MKIYTCGGTLAIGAPSPGGGGNSQSRHQGRSNFLYFSISISPGGRVEVEVLGCVSPTTHSYCNAGGNSFKLSKKFYTFSKKFSNRRGGGFLQIHPSSSIFIKENADLFRHICKRKMQFLLCIFVKWICFHFSHIWKMKI